jgi:hypothetical protein
MSADRKSRKDLLREFREQGETGGVYALRNTTNGKRLILSTNTISKAQSQLDFAKATGSCVHPLLADDWKKLGADAFALEILETLERKDTQTNEEFREDVKALEELWREKLQDEGLY